MLLLVLLLLLLLVLPHSRERERGARRRTSRPVVLHVRLPEPALELLAVDRPFAAAAAAPRRRQRELERAERDARVAVCRRGEEAQERRVERARVGKDGVVGRSEVRRGEVGRCGRVGGCGCGVGLVEGA